MELMFHVEHPLKKGVTPAQSEPEYGAGGKDAAVLPTGAPEGVTGGTGFNDARTLHPGVWRDKVLPAQTRWYKVPRDAGRQGVRGRSATANRSGAADRGAGQGEERPSGRGVRDPGRCSAR